MTDQNNNGQPNEAPTIDHDANEARRTPYTTKFFVGIGLAAVIALGAGAAMAQGGFGPKGFGPMGGHFGERRLERIMEDVGASDDQQDKIWAIVDKARGELRPVGREFRGTRDKLAELLSAPAIDKAAIEQLRAERVAAIDASSKTAVDALVEAAEVLTPEQRTKLVEKFKERGERHGRFGGPRGPEGRDGPPAPKP